MTCPNFGRARSRARRQQRLRDEGAVEWASFPGPRGRIRRLVACLSPSCLSPRIIHDHDVPEQHSLEGILLGAFSLTFPDYHPRFQPQPGLIRRLIWAGSWSRQRSIGIVLFFSFFFPPMGIVLGQEPAHLWRQQHPAMSCALLSHHLFSKPPALAPRELQTDTGPGEPQVLQGTSSSSSGFCLESASIPVLPDSQRTTGRLALLGM